MLQKLVAGGMRRPKDYKKSNDTDPTYAHAILLYNLLEALGDEVPSHLWVSLT